MFCGSAKTDEPSEMLFRGRIVWVHKTRIRWGAIGVIWRIRRNDLRRGNAVCRYLTIFHCKFPF